MIRPERKEYQRQWYLRNKERYKNHCKQWRKNNPERCAELQKIYRAKNKEMYIKSQRKTDLKRHYGMTVKEYDCSYDLQRGKCLICDEEKKILCVDHNHTTGKIRGLLCRRCNLGLGFIEKSPKFYLRAQQYLNERIG